ncbi:MAG: S9 family peptidase, partial [Thermococci archaeon]|nr:S9 family peptidase [Thermococci archaeon]
ISYGGFMTNWAVTQSDLFKAGVSENGISYWLTSYAFSDIGLWFDVEVVGPNPLENENYRKLSPLFYAKNVKAPVLFIHSLEDYRCPLDQSLMFYNVLKDLGKEAYIAVFRRGPHGHSLTGSPRHRAKRYRLFVEFFERKLKKGEEFNVDEVMKGLSFEG